MQETYTYVTKKCCVHYTQEKTSYKVRGTLDFYQVTSVKKGNANMKKLIGDLQGVAVGILLTSAIALVLREVVAYGTNGQLVGFFADQITSSISGAIIISIANWWTWRNVENLLDNEEGLQAFLLAIIDLISSVSLTYFFWQQKMPPSPWPPAPQNVLLLIYWAFLVIWAIWMLACVVSYLNKTKKVRETNAPLPQTVHEETPLPSWRKRLWKSIRIAGIGVLFLSGGAFIIVFLEAIIVLLNHNMPLLKLWPVLGDQFFYIVTLPLTVIIFLDARAVWILSEKRCFWYQNWEDPPWKEQRYNWKGPYVSVWVAAVTGGIQILLAKTFIEAFHKGFGFVTIIALITVVTNIYSIYKSWRVHLLKIKRPTTTQRSR